MGYREKADMYDLYITIIIKPRGVDLPSTVFGRMIIQFRQIASLLHPFPCEYVLLDLLNTNKARDDQMQS